MLPPSTRTTPPSADEAARVAAGRWSWWFGPLAFLTALLPTAMLSGTVAAVTGGGHRAGHVVSLLGALLQDATFVAVAVMFARGVGRVRPASFGLRPARLAPAAGLVALSLLVFYGASAAWQALVARGGEQDTLAALGARETGVLLVASAILVVAVAPLAEEVFFRGFFYRALRNRLGAPAAIAAVALLFGAIHYTGPSTLSLLPMLALLGALFCLLYEITGSLWPAVALHTINNTVAFAATLQRPAAVAAAAAVGLSMLAACIAVPCLGGSGDARRPRRLRSPA